MWFTSSFCPEFSRHKLRVEREHTADEQIGESHRASAIAIGRATATVNVNKVSHTAGTRAD
jgi:hypothetical protein